MNYNKEAMTL